MLVSTPSLALLLVLTPASAPAPERWHDEYREDLNAALEAGKRRLQAPSGDRAEALVELARVHRLRGEFADAEARLTEADTLLDDADAELEQKALALIERQWVALDRFSGAAGTLNKIHEDVRCVWPEGAGSLIKAHATLSDIYQRWQSQNDGPRMMRTFGVHMWHDMLENLALFRENIDFAARTAGPADPVVTGLRDQHREFFPRELAHVLGGLGASPAQIGVLQRRISAQVLVLARTPSTGDIVCPALLAGTPNEPGLAGQDALTCAEAQLFPAGVADTLGLSLGPQIEKGTMFTSIPASWAGATTRTQRVEPKAEAAGLAALAAAEAGFRSAGNTRGLARVAFVRAAVGLVDALADAARLPAGESAARAAVAAAERAGDGRLALQARVFMAALATLRSDQPGATRALQPALAAIRKHRAFGLGISEARLLATLAASRIYVGGDPAAAEQLDILALALYRAAGGVVEALDLQLRHAEAMRSAGLHPQARSTLAATLDQSQAPGCGVMNRGPVDRRLLDVHGAMIELAHDASDEKALEHHLDHVNELLATLGEGDNRTLNPRLAEATARVEDTRRQQQALLQAARTETGVAARSARNARFLALQEQLHVANERALGLTTAAAYRAQLLPTWSYFLEHLRDRAAIVDNPNLPPTRWYRRAEAAAAAISPRTATMIKALLTARRGDYAAARAIWRTRGESTDVARMLALLRSQAPEKADAMSLQQSFAEMTIDVDALLQLHDYAAADQKIAAIAAFYRERGGSGEWYSIMHEPWSDRANTVVALTGLGRHAEALTAARMLVDSVDARRDALASDRFRLAQLGVHKTSVYGAAVAAAAAAGRADAAFEFIERGKARGLRDRLSVRPDSPTGRLRALAQAIATVESVLAENPAAGIAAQVGPDGKRGATNPLAARLAGLRREYAAARATAPEPADATTIATAVDVARGLPAGSVLLDYFITDEHLVVVALAPGQAPIVHARPVVRATLEGQIQRLGLTLVRAARDPAILQRHADTLAALVFPAGPIRDRLLAPETRAVYVAPHEILHQIPFSMLPLGGRPLVERATVHHLPFAGSLARSQRPRGELADRAAVLRFVGDPGKQPLRFAGSESAEIAHIHRVEVDGDPTRADVLRALTRARIVHIVAHARAPERDGFATIDLPRRDADPGDLSVVDVLAMADPVVANTVVLSACELATGAHSDGDEGVGLPRALLEKGAGTVIAPLWRIHDDPTIVSLMQQLHRRLRKGTPAAEALAQVQRDAIRGSVDPRQWAALLAIGG